MMMNENLLANKGSVTIWDTRKELTISYHFIGVLRNGLSEEKCSYTCIYIYLPRYKIVLLNK